MSQLTRFALVALVSALLIAPTAVAQEEDPLVGDRPDFTESAITIAPGRVQIEAGVTFTDDDSTESYEIGEVLARIGLTERLELRVGLNSYARVEPRRGRDQSGFVDSSLGIKLTLGEYAGWTTAVLASTSLPTGSSEFRESRLQPDAVLAAERDLTDNVSIGTNLGYAYASDGGRRFGEAFASVAVGIGITETTGAFFEIYGFARASAGGPETYFFDTGVTHALGPNLQVDVRIGTGLNSAAEDLFVGAGVIWRR